jgi:chromate transporter
MRAVAEIFWTALQLGLTSFGGPIAHLGYFQTAYVEKRRWLSQSEYAEIVTMSQILPGPASSQVGMAIGLLRAGLPGAVASWLGFTLPSAIFLYLFAIYSNEISADFGDPLTKGLLLVAMAVVAQAVFGMWQGLIKGRTEALLAVLAAAVLLAFPAPGMQVAVLGLGGLVGWLFLKSPETKATAPLKSKLSPRAGLICLGIFTVLLVGLPLGAQLSDNQSLKLGAEFYRAGALVFGGGHVVLPLLETALVPQWLDAPTFLTGYAAAQAVPGPLFTFASYLGAKSGLEPAWGALLGTVGIFAPGFLLIVGVIPFWAKLRGQPKIQTALAGVNASVVGILLAALYDPVFTSAVMNSADLALVILGVGALIYGRLPPWSLVLGFPLAVWLLPT